MILLFTIVYLVAASTGPPSGFGACGRSSARSTTADFWRHERFWKLAADSYLQLFNGTPFKSLIWRLLGVRIGRRVFDDGCRFAERRSSRIGDDCTLNAGTIVQCHSQEDGAFKSDRIAIGAGCTLGVGAFVHYGVTMGDGAVLAPDSFLMKGEEVPRGARWGGNPARRCPSTRRPTSAAGTTRTTGPPPWQQPDPATVDDG